MSGNFFDGDDIESHGARTNMSFPQEAFGRSRQDLMLLFADAQFRQRRQPGRR
jgi:hypothetical protein